MFPRALVSSDTHMLPVTQGLIFKSSLMALLFFQNIQNQALDSNHSCPKPFFCDLRKPLNSLELKFSSGKLKLRTRIQHHPQSCGDD